MEEEGINITIKNGEFYIKSEKEITGIELVESIELLIDILFNALYDKNKTKETVNEAFDELKGIYIENYLEKSEISVKPQ